MLQLSTGLRSQLLDTASFRTIFNLSFLDVYAGTIPLTADAAISNTKLVRYSNNNTGTTGLTFAAAVAGIISKTLAEVWSGTSLAAGTATFYRLVTSGDTNALSTSFARVQGYVGVAGSELLLPTTALLNATLYTIDNYSFTIPTL